MPKSCAECPICHCKGKDDPWNYCCFATMDDINIEEWDEQRYITCPLKEVNECKAEDCTNGDMIKAMFPHYDIEVYEHKGYVRVFYDDFYTTYPWQWWNSPYKGNIYPKSDRPSGTWLQCGQGVWECSNCGNGVVISKQWLYKHHKYCGQCGAKMK